MHGGAATWLLGGRGFISSSDKLNTGGATVQTYLTPPNCTLNNTMVELMLCMTQYNSRMLKWATCLFKRLV